MKKLKILLVPTIVFIGTLSALELKDYAKGGVDKDGNNLWHVLAQGCDKQFFNEYIKQLIAMEATAEDEDMLSFLVSQRNNYYQSSLEIAAENWAPHESADCANMIKMICAWKTVKRHRGKATNPFAMLLEAKEEDKAKNEKEGLIVTSNPLVFLEINEKNRSNSGN